MRAPNLNILWAESILRSLREAGVRSIALCPGSRSGPLAAAADRMGDISLSVHLDERSAAYFALGAAKGSGRPGKRALKNSDT